MVRDLPTVNENIKHKIACYKSKVLKKGANLMQIIPMRDLKNTVEVERRCAEENGKGKYSE